MGNVRACEVKKTRQLSKYAFPRKKTVTPRVTLQLDVHTSVVWISACERGEKATIHPVDLLHAYILLKHLQLQMFLTRGDGWAIISKHQQAGSRSEVVQRADVALIWTSGWSMIH